VIDGPLPLGLLPAREQRIVAGGQRHLGRVRAQQLVQTAGRGPHGLAVHLDGRELVAVEVNERVEQVEEDRGVPRAQSGLRLA
jgi:hypothetical protein